MVIKRPGELRGESAAFGHRSASSMSKYSASVNSDLGNGFFWVETHWAQRGSIRQQQPVSCNFQHPWTQRCSVLKRALSLSTHPRGTHASSSCSCTVKPINWLAESVLWTDKARLIFFHTASTCRSVLWATVVTAAQKFGVESCMNRAVFSRPGLAAISR